jgi:hypothetical protein
VTSSVARKLLDVLRAMEEARNGSAAAGARLPVELRSLVDELTAEGRAASPARR